MEDIEKSNDDKEEKKKKKCWIIVVIIIIIVLLLAFLALFLFCKFRKYTISFDTDGAPEIASIEIKNNETVTLPEAPKKDAFVFGGWADENNSVVTEGTIIAKDFNLKAIWIDETVETVTTTFDTDGGNTLGNIVIENGGTIRLPIDPVKKGYTFTGWADEDDNVITEGLTLTKDIKLKAIWVSEEAETIIATFDTDGGNIVKNMIIESGIIVRLPIPQAKPEYVFGGWTDDNGNIVTSGVKVTADINLKAVWIPKDAKTVNVSFEVDEENKIGDVIIENGGIIKLPIEPSKEGYIFVGWADENDNIITKETVITKDTKLKAVWIDISAQTATISFNTDGGSIVQDIIVEKGEKVRLPVPPTKNEYVFAGWVDGNGAAVKSDTLVTESIILKATWKEPYTCPDNCTPNGNGSTCSKGVTASLVNKSVCPDGYSLIEGKCLNTQGQLNGFDYSVLYCSDGRIVDGDCEHLKYSASSMSECRDNEFYRSSEGVCVPYSKIRYDCPDGYASYTYIFGMGAEIFCARQANKINVTVCPDGYTRDGNTCRGTQILNCTAN